MTSPVCRRVFQIPLPEAGPLLAQTIIRFVTRQVLNVCHVPAVLVT